MSVGTAGAIAIAAGAAGSVASSIIGGSAAKSAAQTQADAGTHAADLQNQQYLQNRQDQLPWLQNGQTALAQLMAGINDGSLLKSYSGVFTPPAEFHAPTAAEAEATPGYEFTKEQGNKAILQAATAMGGIGGGTLRQIDKYNTGLAEATYGDTFNRSLSTYQNNYNSALTNFQTNFNAYNTNQSNQYNRLAGISGVGQNTAATLGQQGLQSQANIGNLLTSAAAAQAGGIVGQSNAITGGISNFTNNLTGYLQLQQLMQNRNLPNIGGGLDYTPPAADLTNYGYGIDEGLNL